MTEQLLQSEDPELDKDGRRIFTVTMLTYYRDEAMTNYAEAEELLHRALDLRDAGHAMLKRASELAYQQALDEDSPSPDTVRQEDDTIPW